MEENLRDQVRKRAEKEGTAFDRITEAHIPLGRHANPDVTILLDAVSEGHQTEEELVTEEKDMQRHARELVEMLHDNVPGTFFYHLIQALSAIAVSCPGCANGVFEGMTQKSGDIDEWVNELFTEENQELAQSVASSTLNYVRARMLEEAQQQQPGGTGMKGGKAQDGLPPGGASSN